jgi:hypothetical protein
LPRPLHQPAVAVTAIPVVFRLIGALRNLDAPFVPPAGAEDACGGPAARALWLNRPVPASPGRIQRGASSQRESLEAERKSFPLARSDQLRLPQR